jgi:tRNA (guanine37-N1)-methyltransferase
MITFHIITIFPKIFESFLEESFIKKAREKKLIGVKIYDLRKFTSDKRKSVDDRPYGGGLGMVLKVEPIYKAVKFIKSKIKNQKSKIILFTPRGKQFTQKMAHSFSKLKHLIFICGRYEGVDERVAKYIADLELSIGPYDLMGGELPAMIVIEAVTRLIPGVIGKPEFLKERIFKGGFVEYPQYTRPEIFSPKKGVYWKVPKVLLSGNHQKIKEWREKRKKIIE